MKHRLLGAAVLIALAVIFVPMFLAGSGPGRDSETVDLQIPPAPDREFQTRVLPADGHPAQSTTPAPTDPNVVVHESLPTVEAGTPARIEQPTEPVVTPKAAQSPTTASEAARTEAAQPAPDKTSAKPAEPPVAATPEKEKPSAPTAVSSLPGTAADGTFFVHLGDYTAAKNANDLVATLKKDGFAAFAEPSRFGGKATTRVRVGPFATRTNAEATRVKIAKTKVRAPASVVQDNHDAKADAPASALPANRAGAWAVQIGAFATADEANRRRDQLRNNGFAGFVDQVSKGDQTLWRVRAGPEVDRVNAEKLRDRIRDKLRFDGVIVTQP